MTRKTLLTLGLLAVFMLSACTPGASAPTSVPDSGAMEEAAPPTAEPAPMQGEAPTAAPAPTEAMAAVEPTAEEPANEPMAAPTSRGNQLVATDPNTVNLASGKPQLIEFFAFW